MSLGHSPSIVTDGLVFYYDMGNTKRSWKGAPVTNLAKTSTGAIDWSIGNLTQSVSRSTIIDGEKYRITSTSLTGTSFRIYFNLANLTNALTYTLSFKYQIISGSSPLFRTNDWCDQSITRNTYNLGSDIYYETATGTKATYDATYRFMDFEISNNTVVDIWDLQLEQNTFATPYTTYNRSSTQSILDLTENNTVTISSLVYESDNTISFGTTGGANYFYIPSIDFSNEQTIEIWLKPTENDAVRRNPYNQAYGGYGTWTHEPSGNINYYYGDAGASTTPYIGHASSFTVLQNEIACVCTTRDTSTSWWHKNGVRYNSYSHAYGQLTTDTNNILIGNGYAGAYYGQIYSVKLYNRALTADEVAQNFNALRGRFGI